ncbi:asparagine synthase (glutamine-hydrolyzing) [Brevifollis gellanilyticus]|uniref:asparagine synthase (glutamine-hydrolyzing) n=1 Tax=Brevifollis gellanilyticus TaxID=748831 RepID=A0A512MAU4_9BACT|nr:asparagine synthase (glutamine-hydrolyzing) [Brevifollis gellanilyticus]GEP43850.1 asparagine synthetase B [Brevifollis gellanilyticus]
MCAIAGILDFSSTADPSASAGKVRHMISRLRHRGPDDEGYIQSGPCTLGAARLAQIDRAGGAQPMRSPDDRYAIVLNGEIHNHRALRAELSLHWHFTTRSDTEVLLAAFATWGREALRRLNGMFAFFIWDAQTHRGFAARDCLGVKPFVWMPQPQGGFAFASEAKALLHLLPSSPVANEEAILEHLVAPCFSGVRTSMFAGMHHLQPGHWLSVDRHGIQQGEWSRYDLHRATELSADELVPAMHDLLPKAIERTLDADAPAAVLLSGGLDSTLVAALAKQHGVTQAYTISFEGQDAFDYAKALMVKSDDLPCSIEAASDIGLQHRIVPVSRASLADDMRTLALQNDALPAWEQELAQHHLAKALAADGHRAVLVGDAADETHYGYGFMLDDQSISHPGKLLARFGSPPLNAEMQQRAAHIPHDLTSMMREAGHADQTRADRLRGITHLITRLWLPRLLHNGDIHMMAHGVEARVPLADTDLLDLAVRVHPELALKDGVEKSLLREAARGLMPEAARVRRKSSLSKDDGSATVLKSEALHALDASADFLFHWLDLPALRQMCSPHYELAEMQRALLFRIICLHHWAAAYHVRLP